MAAAAAKPEDAVAEGCERPVERHRGMRDDPEREARWAAWRTENAAAIQASNAWVEEHGLPLARYRLF